MKKISELFESEATNTQLLSSLANGHAGFVIPEYQRPYDWSSENIDRFFSDTLTGFARLNDKSTKESTSDYTFLGSVILVEDESKERAFKGVSYSIIDGQQRLTTLILCACSLSVALRKHRSKLNSEVVPDADFLAWLVDEIDTMTSELDECVVGRQKISAKATYPFPRIIRAGGAERGDSRGSSPQTSEYVTPIGQFIEAFSKHISDDNVDNPGLDFHPPASTQSTPETTAARKIRENYRSICRHVEELNEFDELDVKSIGKKRFRNLFNCLSDHFQDQDDINSKFGKVANNQYISPMIRTLLFSLYVHKCIILTQIVTKDESAAFDIFDSLNTTGQPLTALETLRPRVVRFENEEGKGKRFLGSESYLSYLKIENYIDEKYPETSKKQTITRELIISFALFLVGKKLGRLLTEQRLFLKNAYEAATKDNRATAHRMISEIADMSEFRYHYFDCKDKDSERMKFHSLIHKDCAQLLSSFISAMNTSIAIPVLYRYWTLTNGTLADEDRFIEILKAVTAFIVLRRAATGTTDGIESDFRDLMSSGRIPHTDLDDGNCIGNLFDRKIMTVAKVKSAFLQFLENKIENFDRNDKQNWVKKVIENPLYRNSRPLVKFMMLIAADQAKPCDDGTWSKSGVRPGSVAEFFTYDKWIGEDFHTVEHVAPDKKDSKTWGSNLDESMQHRLGNLILLPLKENASIGNHSWEKKRIFYRAATSADDKELDDYLDEAARNNVKLPPKTVKLLKSRRRLELLRPLIELEEWDSEIVELRSINIAELCWDTVMPWLK